MTGESSKTGTQFKSFEFILRLFNELAPYQSSRLILVVGEVDAHLTTANETQTIQVFVGILRVCLV